MSSSLQDALIGTWRLVEFESRHSDGRARHPLTAHATGLLVYTREGWMAGQLMRPRRPTISGSTITRGSDDELRAIASGYVAYAGPFHVDEARRTVIHRVVLSLFPNLIGTEQLRYVAFDGGRMELRTPPEPARNGSRTSRLVWERVEADEQSR
jgi:hypothetical protein